MANVNAPFGLKPVRTTGAPSTGTVEIYSVAAGDGTAIYIGDPVTTTGVGTAQTINGVVYPDCVIAATTDIMTGVVVGVMPDTSTSLPYRAASTARRLMVATDPNLIFEVQEGNSGTPFTANDAGLNCSLTITAGNATTGLSGTVLDNTTEATANTLAVKLIAPVNRPDLSIGLANRWLVRLNRHRYVDQMIGV